MEWTFGGIATLIAALMNSQYMKTEVCYGDKVCTVNGDTVFWDTESELFNIFVQFVQYFVHHVHYCRLL
jgi:hypothetical protein